MKLSDTFLQNGSLPMKAARASLVALALCSTALSSGALAQASNADIKTILAESRFDDAVAAIEKMQKDGKADAETYLLLAKAYLETGSGIAAEAAVDRARRLGADYAKTAVPFAKTQLLQGKYADALGAIRGVQIPAEMQDEATVIAGDANFALNKYAEARRNYEIARKANAASYQAYLGLARLDLQEGKLAQAAAFAAQAHEYAPGNTMVRYTQGLIARYQGDRDLAEKYFAEAQELFPGNILANIELAAIRIDQHRLDEAQGYLDAIYAVAPHNPMALYLSGTILVARERYEEADALLNAARSVTENYLPAIYIRGLVAYQLGKYPLAEDLLTKVLQARPANVPARLALVTSLLKQSKPQAAMTTLRPLLTPDVKDTNILTLAAAAAIGLGDTASGEAYYVRLAEVSGSSDRPSVSGIHTKLALAQFVAGDKDEALSGLVRATSNTDADVRSLAVLAGMQMREKDLGGAEETIRKMIAAAPDRALGYNMKGSLEYSRKQFPEALRSFDEAVRRNPEYYTAIRNKALVQIQLNELKGAESDLKRLLEISPNDARAKAMLGRVLLRRDKAAEAVDYFGAAVRAIPNSVDIWADYSEALAGAGKTSDAISQAKDTAVMAADRPDILKRMGLLLLRLNEARFAIRPLSRYVAFNPDSGDAHVMQGRAMLAMGLFTGAKTSFERARQAENEQPDGDVLNWYLFTADALAEHFDKALKRKDVLLPGKRPDDVPASVVGDLLLASGQVGAAIEAYRSAMAIEDNSRLSIGLAKALEASGDLDGAVATLRRFVEKRPTDRAARLELGGKLERQGNMEDAAKQYEAILRGGVADAQVAARLANAYLRLGNRQSIALVERAYLIRPEDPFILDSYGWIMLQAERDTSRAIEALEQATRRAPASALYRFHLGMAYLARGRRDEAAQAFEDALNLDAAFSEAEEARRQLNLLK